MVQDVDGEPGRQLLDARVAESNVGAFGASSVVPSAKRRPRAGSYGLVLGVISALVLPSVDW
jgi:hypothetical protein